MVFCGTTTGFTPASQDHHSGENCFKLFPGTKTGLYQLHKTSRVQKTAFKSFYDN